MPFFVSWFCGCFTTLSPAPSLRPLPGAHFFSHRHSGFYGASLLTPGAIPVCFLRAGCLFLPVQALKDTAVKVGVSETVALEVVAKELKVSLMCVLHACRFRGRGVSGGAPLFLQACACVVLLEVSPLC